MFVSCRVTYQWVSFICWRGQRHGKSRLTKSTVCVKNTEDWFTNIITSDTQLVQPLSQCFLGADFGRYFQWVGKRRSAHPVDDVRGVLDTITVSRRKARRANSIRVLSTCRPVLLGVPSALPNGLYKLSGVERRQDEWVRFCLARSLFNDCTLDGKPLMLSENPENFWKQIRIVAEGGLLGGWQGVVVAGLRSPVSGFPSRRQIFAEALCLYPWVENGESMGQSRCRTGSWLMPAPRY